MGKAVHQRRHAAERRGDASVFLVVHEQRRLGDDADIDGVLDRRDQAVRGDDARGHYQAIGAALLEPRRDIGDRHRAHAGADEPDRHIRLLPDIGDDRGDILRMLGAGAELAETLAMIRRRVDRGDEKAGGSELVARADEKILAPEHRPLRTLQDAVAAGEEYDRRDRWPRRRHEPEWLDHVRPRRKLDELLAGHCRASGHQPKTQPCQP